MTRYRSQLPQLDGDIFLAYVGMETDLIFNEGIDLPGFASYPLLETDEGQALLRRYFTDMILLGRDKGTGIILESPTWVANRDRGAALGHSVDTLKTRNIQSVALMETVRATHPDVSAVISVNVGPRADAYAPAEQMNAQEAEDYHTEQISVLAETAADVISGYTFAYPEEAIGLVRAAERHALPAVIAFTVETDGCLPTGMPLKDAIARVDAATNSYASYFMINCAHPDHFAKVLDGGAWMERLRGVVANASRCSHAELDEAEELDDGNPAELGAQLASLHDAHPGITILGGCCGTDMRHMTEIANAVVAN